MSGSSLPHSPVVVSRISSQSSWWTSISVAWFSLPLPSCPSSLIPYVVVKSAPFVLFFSLLVLCPTFSLSLSLTLGTICFFGSLCSSLFVFLYLALSHVSPCSLHVILYKCWTKGGGKTRLLSLTMFFWGGRVASKWHTNTMVSVALTMFIVFPQIVMLEIVHFNEQKGWQ